MPIAFMTWIQREMKACPWQCACLLSATDPEPAKFSSSGPVRVQTVNSAGSQFALDNK